MYPYYYLVTSRSIIQEAYSILLLVLVVEVEILIQTGIGILHPNWLLQFSFSLFNQFYSLLLKWSTLNSIDHTKETLSIPIMIIITSIILNSWNLMLAQTIHSSLKQQVSMLPCSWLFFLGVAFPIFYPIAMLAITIQYVVERFTLALFYRLPPKFSLDLTLLNLNILSYAPLSCLILSFWLFGNH